MDTGDELVVPTEVPSKVEEPSKPAEPEKPAVAEKPVEAGKPAEPPSAEALAKQLSDLRSEMTKTVEEARRSIQSAKDKARAEVESAQRRAAVVENTFNAARQELEGTDPGMAKDLELARYRAEQAEAQQRAIVAEKQAGQMQFHQRFVNNIMETLKELGIDQNTPDVDWGQDAPSYMDMQNRVMKSAIKKYKTSQETSVKELTKQVADLQKQLKKYTGEADSVDTSNPSGGGSSSDKEFIRKFADGDIPLTKSNIDRYHKIVGT